MLETLRLTDFRGFEDYSISFRSGINLLIGDNGSGKTSVIRAVVLTMNSFFKSFSDENTSCSGVAKADFRHHVSNESKSLTRPVGIFFKNRGMEHEIGIVRKSMKKSSTTYQNATEYNRRNRDLYHTIANEDGADRHTPLPLFCYFATDDIHTKVGGISEKAFKDYYLSPSFGYYYALKGGFLAKYWIRRLLVLAEGGKSEDEVQIVKDAILSVLGINGCGIVNSVDVRPKQGFVYFVLADGREVRFEDLSDGYVRLVNTVMDIAFRCAILNRTLYGMNTCKETAGMVCIDEIDDHLHPSLQSKVLKALHHAFPQLQFVVSTHAPMVMTSVDDSVENIVYRLDYRDGEYRNEQILTYGLDASTIIKTYLHQQDKDSEVQQMLDRLFELIDDEDLEQAKRLLNDLEQRFSERLPEIARARTLLTFYDN